MAFTMSLRKSDDCDRAGPATEDGCSGRSSPSRREIPDMLRVLGYTPYCFSIFSDS